MRKRSYGALPKYEGAMLKDVLPNAPKQIVALCKKFRTMTSKKFFQSSFNFYLFGSYRVGKSWALHAILNHIRLEFDEQSVYYIDSPTLVNYFRTNALIDGETSWVNYLGSKKVLIIDDLGQEYRSKETGFAESKIETFIRWRVNRKKITFLGGNASADMLCKVYGESFGELIRGEFVQFEVSDVNFSQTLLDAKLGKE